MMHLLELLDEETCSVNELRRGPRWRKGLSDLSDEPNLVAPVSGAKSECRFEEAADFGLLLRSLLLRFDERFLEEPLRRRITSSSNVPSDFSDRTGGIVSSMFTAVFVLASKITLTDYLKL